MRKPPHVPSPAGQPRASLRDALTVYAAFAVLIVGVAVSILLPDGRVAVCAVAAALLILLTAVIRR